MVSSALPFPWLQRLSFIRARPHVLRLLLGLGLLLSQACYDHSFTQAVIARRRAAKAAEGAKIRATPAVQSEGGGKVARVRLYVSDAYRRQHGEWRKPWLDVTAAATEIVGPSFGVRFEVLATKDWSPKCDEAQLSSCLDELAALDPGEDGDWVVGVLGSMSRFSASFDELGMAHVPGRHIVLRDVSDLAERDAIDRAFPSLTASRRDEIYKRRRAHKRLSVFLHEWGHTLGALHVESSDSLLHAYHDDRMQSYDAGNQQLIEAGLRDRFRYSGQHDELIAALQGAQGGDWLRNERELLLERLEHKAQAPQVTASAGGEQPAPPAQHPFVAQGDASVLLAGVEPVDRQAYREAVRLTQNEDARGAWLLAEPLSERYPNCHAVQHLACGLAMSLGLMTQAQSTCGRVSPHASAKP